MTDHSLLPLASLIAGDDMDRSAADRPAGPPRRRHAATHKPTLACRAGGDSEHRPYQPPISASANDSSMTADGYRTLMSLAEQGVLTPVIDSVVPFARIVEAHRRVDGGHIVVSVAFTVGQDD